MNDKEKEIKQQDNTDSKIEIEDTKLNLGERLKDLMNDPKYRVVIVGILSLLLIIIIAVTLTTYFDKQNEKDASSDIEDAINSTSERIRINEYVISNNNTFRDDKWNSPDWIELYNYGDEPVWLANFYLSDTENLPTKFNLPEITLMPGEYVIVLASGKTDDDDEYIRATFQLGQDDKVILLSTKEHTVDKVDIDKLPTDISAGYISDGSFGYFSEPTPCAANDTLASDTIEITPINSYENLVIINEYSPSNTYRIADDEGEYHDWIELYNPNSYPVSVGDMYLSDDENEGNKFKLPDVEMAANDYLLIYASGKISSSSECIHAPFRISASDSKIVLSHKGGYVINSCDVYDLPQDVSAGIDESGKFGFFTQSTPGEKNDTALSESIDNLSPVYVESSSALIVINEWMTNNQFGILDANGDASDWIELYNTSGEDISLKGYALSDDYYDLLKWVFPDDAVIPANGYLMVYASGKNKVIDEQIHTNFSLCEGETLYLMKIGEGITGSVGLEYLPGNVSKGKTSDGGYGYFSLPTPGKANTTAFSTEIDASADFIYSDVYISEVAASKIHLSRYNGRSMYEYIELYNSGDEKIDLTGYKLYEAEDSYYTFENVFIRPKDYLLIALKGWVSDTLDAIQANTLSLNSAGERILLKNKDDITIDYFDTGYLLGDYSSGRIAGYADTRVFFTQKTPGEENSSKIYTSYSTKPEFSEEGGIKEDELYLTITADDDATIYYTLNGGIPDNESKVYTQPLVIRNDTVVRAIAMSDYKLPSLCTTRTFLMEREHDIPVLCISSAPAGLFYDNSGIYANGTGYGVGEYPYFGANYFRNVERLAAFEYYEEDGETALAFDGGIQIAGGFSRARAQKSLAVRLRDEYGLGEVTYPFFDEGANTFSHLFLRNGGQDGYITMMRDSFIHSCALTLGTVDGKRSQPVAVYINGDYWGVYNLRDKLNADYFRIKYDLDDDVEINILTEYSAPKSGTDTDWLDLKAFCQSNDFSIEENYNKLAERVDVQSFMDYVIIETFFGNADTHNINFWKPEVEGGKWRPVLFDLDLAIFDLGYSMVDDYLGSGFLGYDDHVLDALKKSDIFMDALLQRYSYIICEMFTEEYLLGEIDARAEEIENEMVNHIDRWSSPRSYARWETNVEKLKTYMIKRRNDIVWELQEYFELDDAATKELFPYYQGE